MHNIQVEKRATITGHSDCVYALAPAKEAHRFFSAGGDGMVAEWDLTAPQKGKLLAKVPASVYALHYMPERHWLLIGQNHDGLHVVDVATRKEVGSVQLTTQAIFDIKTHGNLAYVAFGDGVVAVVNLDEMAVVKHLKAAEKSARTIALAPERQEMAVGYSDHSIKIFDLENYSPLRVIQAHTNSVFSLAFSPDRRLLLSGSRDAHLRAWDAEDGYGQAHDVVAHMYAINSVVYHPEGTYFATGSMDKSVKLWDAHTFSLLKVIDKARHAGHGTSVNKLLWTPHENLLISASDDRSISVWDININKA